MKVLTNLTLGVACTYSRCGVGPAFWQALSAGAVSMGACLSPTCAVGRFGRQVTTGGVSPKGRCTKGMTLVDGQLGTAFAPNG